MPGKVKIGVLSLQGSVEEHLTMLNRLPDVEALPVQTKESLAQINGIILPGGESTTISKLLHLFDLYEPLTKRIEEGMPVWGTCCGMILLAKELIGETPHLAVMDIAVRRNAYGRQIDSFMANATVESVCVNETPLVFIRAPWIEKAGRNVEILLKINGHIVAAKEKNMLATSFHPEMTGDLSWHNYFANIVKGMA